MSSQTIEIDERRIRIVYPPEAKNIIDQFKVMLVKVCSEDYHAKLFKKLEIYIVKYPKSEAAYVVHSFSEKGIARIYFGLKFVQENPNEIPAVLVHELTHLWQDFFCKIAKIFKRHILELRKKCSREQVQIKGRTWNPTVSAEVKDKEKYIKRALLYQELLLIYRTILSAFLYQMYAEGIAMYFENYYKKDTIIILSQGNFKKLYDFAKKELLNFKRYYLEKEYFFMRAETLLELKSEDELFKIFEQLKVLLSHASHDIGFHMVFTILYTDPDTTIKELAENYSYFGFAQKYEECITKLGLKPLFSVSSKKGEYDHNTMLNDWYAFWRIANKYYGDPELQEARKTMYKDKAKAIEQEQKALKGKIENIKKIA